MALSEDLRDELAQIAPTRHCCRARRAVGALPRQRCLASARRRASRSTSTWRARRPLGGPSRCCATSASARRSGRITARRSTGRPATSSIRTSTSEDWRCCARPACSRPRARRSSSRPGVSSGDRAVAGPTCAARCSAPARSPGRATRISSSARRPPKAPRSSSRSRRAKVCRCASLERRHHAVAYAKGHEPIGDLLAIAGAGRTALVLEEHAVVAATRARANRLANADEANLVRTARAAHRQLEAIRSLDAGSPATDPCRDRGAAPAPPVRVAARAGREGAAAAHEGGRPAPAERDRPPGRGKQNLICKFSSATPRVISILSPGGSHSPRRRIQTPFGAAIPGAFIRRGRSSSELPLRTAVRHAALRLGVCTRRIALTSPGPRLTGLGTGRVDPTAWCNLPERPRHRQPSRRDSGSDAMTQATFDDLRGRLAEIADLNKTGALLGWDQHVMMPARGAGIRAEQLATIGRISHTKFTDPEIGRLLDSLRAWGESHEYDSFEASLIRVTWRDWEKARRVSPDLRAEISRSAALANPVWVQARRNNDFKTFLPVLRKNLDLRKQYIECFDVKDEPYDIVLDDYERDMTTKEVRRIFDYLKEHQAPLVKEVAALQSAAPPAARLRPRRAEGLRARSRARVRLHGRRLAPRPDGAPVRLRHGHDRHPNHDALLHRAPRRALRDDARVRPRPVRAPGRRDARAQPARSRRLAGHARVAEPHVGEPRRPLAAVLAPLLPAPAGAAAESSRATTPSSGTARSTSSSRR